MAPGTCARRRKTPTPCIVLHSDRYSRTFICNSVEKRIEGRQIAHRSYLGSCFRGACSTVLDTTALLPDLTLSFCLFWAAQVKRCLLHNNTRFGTSPCRQTPGCCCSPTSSAPRLLMSVGSFDCAEGENAKALLFAQLI